MDERRKAPRRILMFYTRVFDDHSGEHLGYLGDMNTLGLMVIGSSPLPVGKEIQLRIELPVGAYGQDALRIFARSVWGHEDIDPEFWNTGFSFLSITQADVDLIERILADHAIR